MKQKRKKFFHVTGREIAPRHLYMICFKVSTSQASPEWKRKVKQIVESHRGIYILESKGNTTLLSMGVETKLTVDEMLFCGDVVSFVGPQKQIATVSWYD